MTCLPEKFIYGWIFSLNSESKELIAYKKTCYDLLFNHFHGTITNRKELLVERIDIETEIHEVRESLKDKEGDYKKLQLLLAKKKVISSKLNTIDKELIKQPELFN